NRPFWGRGNLTLSAQELVRSGRFRCLAPEWTLRAMSRRRRRSAGRETGDGLGRGALLGVEPRQRDGDPLARAEILELDLLAADAERREPAAPVAASLELHRLADRHGRSVSRAGRGVAPRKGDAGLPVSDRRAAKPRSGTLER